MPGCKWRGIRPGARRLEVYNEGLLVYLFDQANLPILTNSGADFQTGFAAKESRVNPKLRKLALEGLFLAYELEQDDGVAVEVVVGEPLTGLSSPSAGGTGPSARSSGCRPDSSGSTRPIRSRSTTNRRTSPGA